MGSETRVSGRRETSSASPSFGVSDALLRDIAEHGFFLTEGSLAIARAACSELMFARAMIEAQTAKIAQLCARDKGG